MAQKIVIDPITRIEGHLRIEAEVDNDKISQAWSSTTMWRGIELILKGRDPRDAWAFAERICGVCTTVHAFASIRAVEDALGIKVPPLAQALRNLIIAMQTIHDHVMHFYHLHALDWVDVTSALEADPQTTAQLAQSLSPWPLSSARYFAEVKDKIKKFVESGQLGIFAHAYWGHPGYKLPPEANLMAVAHYLEGLDWQRHVVRVQTYLGGKNPHPNFLVGGVPVSVNLSSPSVINIEVLNDIKGIVDKTVQFVEQVYIPDLLAIASFYKDWANWGEGTRNFLAYGDLPRGNIHDVESYYLSGGAILDRDLSQVHHVDLKDPKQVQEFVAHSWYRYREGNDRGLHPFAGETTPNYTGPQPPYEHLNTEDKYSWLKAPRWRGHPMEVGPLARMLIGYAKGHKPIKEKVDYALKQLNIPLEALFSTLGRTAARGIETWVMAEYLPMIHAEVVEFIKNGETSTFNERHWDPKTWPKEAQGVGTVAAPRGALAHWVRLKRGKIEDYQVIAPTTWNAAPRDVTGQPGPYEAALEGQPIYDPVKPLEILRTLHSFDPCMACAAHVYDPQGREIVTIKVQDW